MKKQLRENLDIEDFVIVVPCNEDCYNKWEDNFADTICAVEYDTPDNTYNGFIVKVSDVADMIEEYKECDEGNFDLFCCPDDLLGETEPMIDVSELTQVEDIYSVFEADSRFEESKKSDKKSIKESAMISADECEDYITNIVYNSLDRFVENPNEGPAIVDGLMYKYFDEALSHSEFEYDIDYTKDDLEEIGADICDWILDSIEEE